VANANLDPYDMPMNKKIKVCMGIGTGQKGT
jgi:hypothetical protein